MTGAAGVVRDLALLERLADAQATGDPGLGVSALSELVGREKSQVSRALGRLASAGLVERAPDRRYRIGWRVYAIAARTARGQLLPAALGPMRALSGDIGETVHLCVLDGDGIVTLRSELPGHGFRGVGWVGTRVAAQGTSAGRALLMDATAPDLAERFAGASFVPTGPRPRVRDVETLADVVAEARRIGYAAVDEEFEAGVAGVSAPIRDFTGTVVAALNVSAPAVRLRAKLPEVGERTREAAESVSRELGWGAGSSRTGFAGPS